MDSVSVWTVFWSDCRVGLENDVVRSVYDRVEVFAVFACYVTDYCSVHEVKSQVLQNRIVNGNPYI